MRIPYTVEAHLDEMMLEGVCFNNFGSSDFIFQQLQSVMAVKIFPSALPFKTCDVFGNPLKPFNFLPIQTRNFRTKTLVAKRRANTRTESAKIRNRITLKKFNGTRAKPRLNPLRSDPPRSTIEAAECLGEELIKACMDLKIIEISSYDRNGFAAGERMQAFEIAISRHGFLPR
ncbi:RIBOSOMAL L18P/L5E FAMILY PROTEIN [Salix koriyanagi]|uniref:RIBOSOMAL L18P/L5E FAMILY PROTEIN n=1 Tax=Salix koriyanagi TaxID=2511006 RepID=A0A9Q0WJJ0_9ROSI|nr:RIBOSOMAL L18P/L5E FAMILY PROTEIN [Salix koriyanagi]